MKTTLTVLILVAEACLFVWIAYALDPSHAQLWVLPGIGVIWVTKAALKSILWRHRDNDPGPVA